MKPEENPEISTGSVDFQNAPTSTDDKASAVKPRTRGRKKAEVETPILPMPDMAGASNGSKTGDLDLLPQPKTDEAPVKDTGADTDSEADLRKPSAKPLGLVSLSSGKPQDVKIPLPLPRSEGSESKADSTSRLLPGKHEAHKELTDIPRNSSASLPEGLIPAGLYSKDSKLKKHRKNRRLRGEAAAERKSAPIDFEEFPELESGAVSENDINSLLAEKLGTEAANLNTLRELDIEKLYALADALKINCGAYLSRHEVLFEILKSLNFDKNGVIFGGGVLEVAPKGGHGYLRSSSSNYQPCPEDIYVSPLQIRKLQLRTGDTILGQVKQMNDKNGIVLAMVKIESINDQTPEERKPTIAFENLTPYFPTKRILLEHDPKELSTRIIDMVTPIGRGQRGLIVAPPRTGKTVILQKIANSIMANNKDITLIGLLIDERPEEVTDMKRNVNAEIVSSTFDESPERHVQVAEIVIEKAKRMVEMGKHVVILLDSITRLARAYNTLAPHSGRILSGGVDSTALHKPKHFFGAARNTENGGSLTILATALVDTGSRMDEVIFEEFKGTGNMELRLDRYVADKRIYPAINVELSGTRREELMVDPNELELIWLLRRGLCKYKNSPEDAMETLIRWIKDTPANATFLMEFRKKVKDGDID